MATTSSMSVNKIMILAQTTKSGDGVAYSMHSFVHFGQLGRVPIQTFISQTIPQHTCLYIHSSHEH